MGLKLSCFSTAELIRPETLEEENCSNSEPKEKNPSVAVEKREKLGGGERLAIVVPHFPVQARHSVL
ncbi:hypothetical protein AXF42_Ash000382 [Apostasia shenzhenica]|uniref:Uncharacterized protein n=1 Tax=Apostasia shenzhenica TaxID=1088818 RepID=A0A2I0AG85_9ASPA|nr:hypothetical protein AXF42_Ash000382 [Apostasia shenzhenica]